MSAPANFLPVRNYQGNEACSVCRNPLNEGLIVAHERGGEDHPVHSSCISDYLASNKECPTCGEDCGRVLSQRKVTPIVIGSDSDSDCDSVCSDSDESSDLFDFSDVQGLDVYSDYSDSGGISVEGRNNELESPIRSTATKVGLVGLSIFISLIVPVLLPIWLSLFVPSVRDRYVAFIDPNSEAALRVAERRSLSEAESEEAAWECKNTFSPRTEAVVYAIKAIKSPKAAAVNNKFGQALLIKKIKEFVDSREAEKDSYKFSYSELLEWLNEEAGITTY